MNIILLGNHSASLFDFVPFGSIAQFLNRIDKKFGAVHSPVHVEYARKYGEHFEYKTMTVSCSSRRRFYIFQFWDGWSRCVLMLFHSVEVGKRTKSL